MPGTVLITGVGRGLGKAIAHQFHAHGWHVVASDLSPDLLAEYNDREGFLPVTMDVASDSSVQQAFETLKDVIRSLDLIINNAGIDRYFPLSEAPSEHIKQIFEVNFFGACRVNQVFLPLLRKPGGGILAIGSESLHLRMPFLSYPITKRALENYTLALRQELWFSGRWASVIRCGPIRTMIAENVFHLKNDYPGTDLDTVFNRFAAIAPKQVGRMLEPSTVAAFIYQVATKPNPKPIYRLNNRVMLRILAWIPFCIVERQVRRMLR